MKVTCDRCHKQFSHLFRTQVKVGNLQAVEITRTYFKCPFCGKEYNVQFETKKTKQLKEQINKQVKLLGTLRTNGEEEEMKEVLQNIKKKRVRLQREMKKAENIWRML